MDTIPLGIKRIWKEGAKTLVITIDMNSREAYNLNEGDMVDVTLRKVNSQRAVINLVSEGTSEKNLLSETSPSAREKKKYNIDGG